MMKHRVLVTGASGYIGAMLVKTLSEREDVECIIALDKEPIAELISDLPNVTYIERNTADAWQDVAREYEPDIIVHAAWQIRPLYGDPETTWKWNIDGSDAVFDFCLENPFVKKLIHFSTIASYGALASNSTKHFFTEEDPFRATDYLYAEEKRIAENHLREKWLLKREDNPNLSIDIIRPASITGPRGRFRENHFGLQSALSGRLGGSFFNRLVSRMTAFVPVTRTWLRQFIHEDDVVAIVEHLAFTDAGVREPRTFNICPEGDVITGQEMARIVGKRAVVMPPWLIRIVFFLMWHGTLGRIPTARGAWRGYSYPIPVNGGKLAKEMGYQYRYSGRDAITYTNGTYEFVVPPLLRNTKDTHHE